MRPAPARLASILLAVVLALVSDGCSRPVARPTVTLRWLAGHTAPAFDPAGPPDPLRRALERMLGFGLFGLDSAGRVVPLAAESGTASADGRTFTVRLRAGLRFTDGTPATAADFRNALLAALSREDHATNRWWLAPVLGVDRIRPGRVMPPIGIDATDSRTLRFQLTRADTTMAARLAGAELGTPWRHARGPRWGDVVGLGPYRVASEDPGRRLVLVPADSARVRRVIADTVEVRFAIGAPRVRQQMRRLAADLAWPLPPTLLEEPLPSGWRLAERVANPPIRLMLVFRGDVPPTTTLAARNALAYALNRPELLEALGRPASSPSFWLAGAGRFEFPRFDAIEVHHWLATGGFGASFHVVLAYDADGEGAEIARALQGQWSRVGIYAELRPLRGADALAEPLRAVAGQAQLVTVQAPAPGASAELATLVMPLRGPAVGAFRTGWRTREFDPWVGDGPGRALPDPVQAQARLAEDRVALPISSLPWRWAVREGGPSVAFRTDAGPDFAPLARAGHNSRGPVVGSR